VARNQAFSFCQGDYIQWLDADDILAPDKVALQMEVAERCGSPFTLLSSAWANFRYRTDRAKFIPTSLWCDLSPLEWLLRKMSDNLHMQTGTWLESRALTEAAGSWDPVLANDSDGEYFCRVILASDSIRFVPEARVFYRVTPPSRMSHIGRSNEKKNARFSSMQLHVKYILSLENSERVRAACRVYLQNWLIVFYPERPDIVNELQKLAASLGGCLELPKLRWKYAWIEPLFGWSIAKNAQFVLPQSKSYLVTHWDKAMYRLEILNKASLKNDSDGAQMRRLPL
jgi:glycosyltransferase involved in cell wall biosynthesis